MVYDVRDFGAVGDGVVLNTAAIQEAIDEAAENGGGRVLLENGVYKTGSIVLKSFVELHLAANAVLLGSELCEDYPEKECLCHVDTMMLPRARNASLIFAEECTHISITGDGTIDCNGESFVQKAEKPVKGRIYERKNLPTPPRVVFFTGCTQVRIEGVSMVNQPAGWSYWIHDCDYVTMDKLRIFAEVNYPNNDGIHINCSRHVTVSNCNITCGDDCIVLRANSISLKENKPCEQVTVTNCNLTSYTSAVRIGWINDGIIRNCTLSNLVLKDCSQGLTVQLPYLKRNTRQELQVTGGTDIGREKTLVENISFHNIIMDGHCFFPIYITINENPEVGVTAIRNLFFSNIHAKGPEFPRLIGRADCPLENIQFSDCSFVMTDGKEIPNRSTHGPTSLPDFEYHPMVMQQVKNFCMNNTTFTIER